MAFLRAPYGCPDYLSPLSISDAPKSGDSFPLKSSALKGAAAMRDARGDGVQAVVCAQGFIRNF